MRTSQIDKLYPLNPPTFQFIHPAYEAPLFVPLTYLSAHAAYLAWIGFNIAVVGVLLFLLRSQLEYLSNFSSLAIAAAFFPVSYAIAQGQDSMLLTLLAGLALLKLEKGREFLAGVLLGLAAFRFQFLVPIALLFLLWKMWKPVSGMMYGAAGAALLSAAVTGVSGQVQYFRMLCLLAEPSSQHVHRMSNLRAVLYASGIESALVVAIVSTSALMLLAWLGRKLNPTDKLLFVLASSCLLSYHLFLHDMSVLLIPLLLLADRAIAEADYLVLGLLGAAILAPELVIIVASANALWACFVIPVLFISAILARRKPLSRQHLCGNLLDIAHP